VQRDFPTRLLKSDRSRLRRAFAFSPARMYCCFARRRRYKKRKRKSVTLADARTCIGYRCVCGGGDTLSSRQQTSTLETYNFHLKLPTLRRAYIILYNIIATCRLNSSEYAVRYRRRRRRRRRRRNMTGPSIFGCCRRVCIHIYIYTRKICRGGDSGRRRAERERTSTAKGKERGRRRKG